MTKKDYVKAAKMVQEYRANDMPEDTIAVVKETFVQFFSQDNPRFSRERFEEFCDNGGIYRSPK